MSADRFSSMVDTYGAKYSDGTVSQGGYSSHIRAHEYFTFKVSKFKSASKSGGWRRG
jgi:hypothetical protein